MQSAPHLVGNEEERRVKPDPAPAPSTKSQYATSVCAVVVTHYPDTGFAERLHALLPQVAELVIVDNTPRPARPIPELCDITPGRIHHIANGSNLGIATALNQGLEYAASRDCLWLLTLDQDSQCYPDMVRTLVETSTVCQPRPAVIGSNYFDPKLGRQKFPPGPSGAYLDAKTVISSGSLIDVAFARNIGGFRDDYFIDQVDHEFCLRTCANGGRVIITQKPVMSHSVGGLTGPRVPLLGQMLPDHSALRKYYIARNSIVTIRSFWKTEPAWCLKRGIKLFLGLGSMIALEEDRLSKVQAFATGIRHGLTRQMGVCPYRRSKSAL
jgi:rhamnosyltransferase